MRASCPSAFAIAAVVAVLVALGSVAVPAAASDFTGVWTAAVCPGGTKYAPGKCSQFVLELFQKQDRLCGSHTFATASATMVDEAASGPSILGSIADDTANVSLVSSRARPDAPVSGQLKMTGGGLQWKRTDKPGRDDLLPATASFTRSRYKTLFSPVYAQQLSAACNLANTQQSAPPAINGSGGSGVSGSSEASAGTGAAGNPGVPAASPPREIPPIPDHREGG
ncbi:hypothetical protein [Noviherbaspirillum galbum]|uniref:Uncharacterized protein n=1 Tax=Noviherbaspirillum galbum TaxID=2709383 RepID=A0A6B3SY12_9BURK|nr:hypothetical protein [Noviherbaspirillum galbum]NEX63482.1 hypothetical protein [Noviherbaspirillum galbum]